MNGTDTHLVVEGHDETASDGADGEPGDPSGHLHRDLDRWCEVARTTLAGEGITTGRLDLIMVGRDQMAELNLEHMGHEGPTDVLAFPLDGPEAAADGGTADLVDPATVVGDPARHLGDVIVCPEVAVAQAPEHAGSVDAELTLLVVHGVLHVLGHDHAEPGETAAMRARERAHLDRYGFAHPEAG
ncbi:MAG: rRNA maturation RNase YbeY [Actinomycetota bacterium]